MCALPLSKVLPQRRNNSLDAERENFERSQNVSISKAISCQETPVKEKHVRSAIIGTFNEKGAGTFWSVVQKLPLQGNPIVCWKFCHVLHKVLREGHHNAILDSQKYKTTLKDLGKLWGLLKDGYGRLIQCYSSLLVAKLEFHRKNPRFPGSLAVSDEELDDIGERDVNAFFQMSCEFFDYMDEILALQIAVFGSLDMSRSNSMTNCGQCRLAPLIPCIQDSSQLYDYTVKVLFKLHAALPPDTLTGHRDRFLCQFKALQQFYISASNLQYFKHLIHVPLLPENPPNFLVASDLSAHVSPVVILPPHSDTPENETVDMNLVDTTVPKTCEPSPDILEGVLSHRDSVDFHHRNGTTSPESGIEKSQLIEQLQKEIEYLRMEIQRLKIEYERKIDDFKRQMVSLEDHITEQDKKLLCLKEENDELRKQLSTESDAAEVTIRLAETEKKAKIQEEKFHKMKEVYNKLREEHITLIRNKAELDKQVSSYKTSIEKSEVEKQELSQKLLESQNNVTEEEQLQQSEIIKDLEEEVSNMRNKGKELEDLMQCLLSDKEISENALENLRVQFTSLEHSLQTEMDKKLIYLDHVLCEGEEIIRIALNDFDTPASLSNRCAPEDFLRHLGDLTNACHCFNKSYDVFVIDPNEIGCILQTATRFAHLTATALTEGKTTSNSSPNIEQGDKLAACCKTLGNKGLLLFEKLKQKVPPKEISALFLDVNAEIKNTITQMEALVPNLVQDQSQNVADIIDNELKQMDLDIELAAQRIQELLHKTKSADSGMKLEVNGKILDSCTSLMQAVKMLVQSSKQLQAEIVSQGKGFASVTEFYNRNQQWTEGLISAAKVVGLGAKFLVDAADKVVSGQTKFEELVVASQEIAAATAQLVIASRVKAEKGSSKMQMVSQASKKVTAATGEVVATAKSCAEMVEESDVMDFSKLTLHQAKRLEVESQVRLLELESLLEKERVKLAGLRKQHYHLAGASEGWDEEDMAR